MTTRRKAYLRHLALAATAGCIAVTVTTASAAESPLTASAGLDQTIFLQSGRVMTTSVGRQLPVGAPAYVRPFRGFFLPRVWIAPRYYINNWQAYGLPQPAQGYGWSRYYDDAVLTDRQGMVQDSVQAMNWSAAQSGQQIASAQPARQVYSPDYDPYNYDTDLLLGNDQVVAGTHWSSTYADPQPGFDDDPSYPVSAPPPPPVYADNYWDEPAFLEACRRDSGLGGAAIGAAVGGLAGNRIAGRGNRRGGTLIGAGVGAVTGMVIDKAEDRERCRRLLAQQDRGAVGVAYAPPPQPYYDDRANLPYAPPQPAYAADYDPAFLEACRRDNGLGGAAIGAAVGGLAGNRIAGRGNRLGGTLIGAGVGAVAGMVIDKAEDRERCRRLLAQQGTGYAQQGGQGTYGGYPPPPPGYYYYYPPPIVTTITITPGCNCTETVTTSHVTHHAPARHVTQRATKNVRVYRK